MAHEQKIWKLSNFSQFEQFWHFLFSERNDFNLNLCAFVHAFKASANNQPPCVVLIIKYHWFQKMLLALQEIIFVNAFTKVNNMFTTFHISYTFRLGTLTLIFTFTVENTSMNPKYFIHMYWTNFCRLTVKVQKNISEKLITKICSPNIYASFSTFWVKIGR